MALQVSRQACLWAGIGGCVSSCGCPVLPALSLPAAAAQLGKEDGALAPGSCPDTLSLPAAPSL